MSDQIFYLFSAVLLGLVIGALIMYFVTGSNKDPEDTITKLKNELKDYQQDVAEHFEQTADLVDGMTKSYKKVFDHLGKSARKLMTEEQIQKQIEIRKGNKVTLEFLTETTTEEESSLQDEKIHNEKNSDFAQTDEDTIVEKSTSDYNNDSIDEEDNLDDDVIEDKENENEVTSEDDEFDNEEIDLEQEVKNREKNIYS